MHEMAIRKGFVISKQKNFKCKKQTKSLIRNFINTSFIIFPPYNCDTRILKYYLSLFRIATNDNIYNIILLSVYQEKNQLYKQLTYNF